MTIKFIRCRHKHRAQSGVSSNSSKMALSHRALLLGSDVPHRADLLAGIAENRKPSGARNLGCACCVDADGFELVRDTVRED